MQTIEKIGLCGLYKVKCRGRGHYITLDPKAVETYDVKIGDILKIEILEVRHTKQEET